MQFCKARNKSCESLEQMRPWELMSSHLHSRAAEWWKFPPCFSSLNPSVKFPGFPGSRKVLKVHQLMVGTERGDFFMPWISREMLSPTQILYIFFCQDHRSSLLSLCRCLRDQSGWALSGVAAQMLLPVTVTLCLLMP